MNPTVSVIIPTYNESHNIERLVDQIVQLFPDGANESKAEIVVIDDNSPDGTGQLCHYLAERHHNLNVIVRKQERGLGSAIGRGILESKGHIVVVMDADLSHGPTLIPALVDAVETDTIDIAVASRYVDGGSMIAPFHHRIGSYLLNSFIRTVLGLRIRDITGGFIALRRESLSELNFDTIFRGHGDYCIALLYRGVREGWHTKEIPFTYMPRRGGSSKTKFFEAGLKYSLRAVALRVRSTKQKLTEQEASDRDAV